MNIESMRMRSCRSFKVDDADLPVPARERLLAIRRFNELRAAGGVEQAALKEIGVSRRTMFRCKGLRLSVSTVGRILSHAIAAGCVPPASVCEGRLQPKHRRKFDSWAQRWKYGAKPQRPGQLVQIDHMTFSRDGQAIHDPVRQIAMVNCGPGMLRSESV